MVELRLSRSPEINDDAVSFKRHLNDHVRTRALLRQFEGDLDLANTLDEIVEVVDRLDDDDRIEMSKILTGWVKKPRRPGYKSSLMTENIRRALDSLGLLLDN